MHDGISFDWMDTLVMRRVPYASDVFSMVEQRLSPQISFPFSEYRIRAEKNLIAGGFLPSAENIYQALSQLVRLNEQEMQMLMEEEWKAEQEVTLLRRDMAEILRITYEGGKTVTVLADSAWSGLRIRDLLQELGVQSYTMILSSSDVGHSRADGLYALSACGYTVSVHFKANETVILVDGEPVTVPENAVFLQDNILFVTDQFLTTAIHADTVFDADEKSLVVFLLDKSVAQAQD